MKMLIMHRQNLVNNLKQQDSEKRDEWNMEWKKG